MKLSLWLTRIGASSPRVPDSLRSLQLSKFQKQLSAVSCSAAKVRTYGIDVRRLIRVNWNRILLISKVLLNRCLFQQENKFVGNSIHLAKQAPASRRPSNQLLSHYLKICKLFKLANDITQSCHWSLSLKVYFCFYFITPIASVHEWQEKKSVRRKNIPKAFITANCGAKVSFLFPMISFSYKKRYCRFAWRRQE